MQTIKLKSLIKQALGSYRDIFGLAKISIKQNTTLYTFYAIIAALSCTVFIASFYVKGFVDLMSSSVLTPWGIVTSVIVHGGGMNDLVFNLLGLFLWFFFFSITNMNYGDNGGRFSLKSFIALIFAAAFISNFLWLVLRPSSHTSGLSGVVYASEGVVLALSLINSLSLPRISKPFTAEQKRSHLLWLINIFTFAFILLYLVYSPSLFLNEEPNVNVFVHGISFLGAFMFSLLITLRFKGPFPNPSRLGARVNL